MPYAKKEVLEYLAPKYNLYILSNGFRELQSRKMRSAGVDGYFKKVILFGRSRGVEALPLKYLILLCLPLSLSCGNH